MPKARAWRVTRGGTDPFPIQPPSWVQSGCILTKAVPTLSRSGLEWFGREELILSLPAFAGSSAGAYWQVCYPKPGLGYFGGEELILSPCSHRLGVLSGCALINAVPRVWSGVVLKGGTYPFPASFRRVLLTFS